MAQAAPAIYGCSYPYVCIYQTSVGSTVVKALTGYENQWQYPPRVNNFAIYNTRNDDIVRIRTSFGRQYCIAPSSTMTGPYGLVGTLLAVQINTKSYCP